MACVCSCHYFFFSSRRRHTRCALVTGVQTGALPICIALGRTQKVVVPSFTLMAIAAGKWSVPPEKLLRIANGVDLRRYGGEAGKRSPLAGCDIDPAAVVIGKIGRAHV